MVALVHSILPRRSQPTAAPESLPLPLPQARALISGCDDLHLHVTPAVHSWVSSKPPTMDRRALSLVPLRPMVRHFIHHCPTPPLLCPSPFHLSSLLEADGPHLLAVSRHHPAAHCFSGLGGHVTGRRPGAARGDHQAAGLVVSLGVRAGDEEGLIFRGSNHYCGGYQRTLATDTN